MNEEIIFIVGVGIISAIYIIIAKLCNNRRTTDTTRDRIEQAERTNQSVEQSIDRCSESIEHVQNGINGIKETVGKLEESVGRSENIFEQIRKQKLD